METLPFTAGDIGILIVLLASGLLALARGFVSEVLSIAAWIVAALAAIWGYPHLQPFVSQYLQPDILANVVTAASIFVVALIISSAVSHRISAGVQRSSLGSVDRALGLAFGLARGALLVILAYLALIWVFPPGNRPAWLEHARFRPWVEQGAAWVASLVPAGAINETLDRAGLSGESDVRAITDLMGTTVTLPPSASPSGPAPIPEASAPAGAAPAGPALTPTIMPSAPAHPAPLPEIEVEIVPTPSGNAGN